MQSPKRALSGYLSMVVSALLLSACANDSEDLAQHDPGAPANRIVFVGNMYVDHHVLRSVTRLYVADIPQGARHGIHIS